MNYTFISFVLYFFLSFSKCDLPIHALMGDVYGTWKLIQTKNFYEYPETCGGDIPNNNEQNLSKYLKNYKDFLAKTYGDLEELKIKLTIEKTKVTNEVAPRDKWTYLAVRDYNTDDIIGFWTMVYDEGFEIRIKEKTYFGFFKYQRDNTHNCPRPLNESFIDNGNIMCYSTDPTKIHMGWVVDKKMNEVIKEQKFHWGCFYAEKEEDTNVTAFVLHKLSSNHMHNENSDDNNSSIHWPNISPVSTKRNGYNKIRVAGSPKEYGSTKTDMRNIFERKENNIYACKKSDHENIKVQLNMPKEFTWGDAYSSEDFDEDVDDQRMCGSCFAISSAFSLQKRFEIMFLRKYKKKVIMPKLSYKSLLNCSPFNQGCDGGYPFLIGKQMHEFGIATENCMDNNIIDENDYVCKIDMGSFNKETNEEEFNKNNIRLGYIDNKEKDNIKERKNRKNRKDKFCKEIFYSSDYYYIGGCYECSNTYDMMNEILLNGPIIVAINAKSNLLHFYNAKKNQIYTENFEENKVCDLIDKGFNGWQYTNHAINIVGWGEEKNEKNEIIKYWIIRNTWGKNWGYKGYMKIQRGVNLAGIESQAVFIDPDFSRGQAKIILNE